jgi:mRNA interferase YafQ
MRTIKRANQFKKDFKRETSGKSASYIAKLDNDLAATAHALAADEALEERYRDHALTGDWKGHRDCHVRPDLC